MKNVWGILETAIRHLKSSNQYTFKYKTAMKFFFSSI